MCIIQESANNSLGVGWLCAGLAIAVLVTLIGYWKTYYDGTEASESERSERNTEPLEPFEPLVA
jgi:hypothetical protein